MPDTAARCAMPFSALPNGSPYLRCNLGYGVARCLQIGHWKNASVDVSDIARLAPHGSAEESSVEISRAKTKRFGWQRSATDAIAVMGER
jgi:hypothetical protein